jgi:hypothetical protein
MATAVMLFALAMPFSTVNSTSRYLIGLVPLFAAMMIRLAERVADAASVEGGRRRPAWLALGCAVPAVYAPDQPRCHRPFWLPSCVSGLGWD